LTNGFLSEVQVSEVRDRSSILEVVSDYVSLKKTGRNHKGLCPFHSEKTPSFMVNEEKQIFHCFGCGEGGDVFAFLMKVGHFSFPQAVEELAKRYGVTLTPREFSPTRKREMARREVLLRINQIALEYFHTLLMRGKEGEPARRYLSQRSVSRELLEEHQLGYAPEGWNGLVQHLRDQKVDLEMARELGLILPRKREGWYDVFRGRIMFPIFDLHHRPVGFGGRILKEGQPKYINSSESIIYHKGEVLYGLHVAKQHIPEKDCALIVEGYFDLLALHQQGLKNCVATSGTALTPQHLRILKRYTHHLITVFDSDQAGIHANLRCLPLFLEEDLWGKAVLLPKGEDPDTFLRKGHVKEFEKKVAEAIPLFDFFLENLMRVHDPKSIHGKVNIAEEGIALIRRLPEGIQRSLYLKALAEKLDLQESVLHEMLRSSPKGTSKDRTKRSEGLQQSSAEEHFPKPEEMVLRLMARYPEVIGRISEERVLDDFGSPVLRKMAERLKDLHHKRGRLDLAEALEGLEEDLKKRLCALALEEDGLEREDQEKVLEDCIQKIHERRLRRDQSELLRKIKEAEKQPGGKGLEALLLERQELLRKEDGLRRKRG